MGSTRLPGKVLKKITIPVDAYSYYEKTILDILIDRLKLANVNDIIVATTMKKEDDVIMEFCNNRDIKCFRGEENNVIKRVYDCAKEFGIDIIVEVTADCPFVDYRHINYLIERYNRNDFYHYINNCFPLSWPNGFDLQIFSRDVLHHTIKIFNNSPHCGWNIDKFLINRNKKHYPAPEKYNLPEIGLTLDEPEDLEIIRKIFSHFKRIDMSAEEIIDYVLENSEILKINSGVERKIPGDG